MTWNPNIYLTFGVERTRPATELLARIALDAPQRIVDLGCGPGNSTELLTARWPDANIEGIDNSLEMLAEARKLKIKAQWTQSDIASWASHKSYQLIFSNATLQWLPDHAALLPRLMSYVESKGVFAFQVPRNFEEPCHQLIREVINSGPWCTKLEVVRDWWNVLKPDDYFDILEPVASLIDIWETRYIHVLEGEDAVYRWMSGTGLRPFLAVLEGEYRDGFIAEYKRRLRLAYPIRPSGKTLYLFQRLFVIAKRCAF